jgi:hypothetical protein
MTPVSAYLRNNLLGLVAIFFALSGGAYAVTTTSEKQVFNQDLANSSVDSRVIADGGVAGIDIHSAAVGPKKLKLDKLVKYLQTRVASQCADGQSVQGILADGSVICANDDVNAGTITGVTPQSGLTGGGSSGNVTLGIDPSIVQSRVTGTCAGNNAVQAVGQNGAVTCQPTGTGTVTSVGSGFGLTGGPITNSGSLAADPTVLQRRVGGDCTTAGSNAIQSVNQDGTVACGNLQARLTASCAGTHAIQDVAADGSVTCSPSLAAADSFPKTDVELSAGSAPVVLFDHGGITVKGECTAGKDAKVTVETTGGANVIARNDTGTVASTIPGGSSGTLVQTGDADELTFTAVTGALGSGPQINGTLAVLSANLLGTNCAFTGSAIAS